MSKESDFRQRRKENIKRNNDLLRKLNLGGLGLQIKREVGEDVKPKPKVAKKTAAKKIKSPKPLAVPTRRSRRLQGVNVDEDGIPNVNDNELKKLLGSNSTSSQTVDDLKELMNTPVVGDIKLSDLVKAENEEDLIKKFSVFADKGFSSGDFFEELKEHQQFSEETKQLQSDFALRQYETFDPKEIAVGYERITAMYFHPSREKKLIVGGDTTGTVGLWSVTDELGIGSEETGPDISRFKLFTKNVCKVETYPMNTGKLLAASYDGSLRSIQLNTLKSESIAVFQNSYGEALGISDWQFSYEHPNVLYMTTLTGEFTQFDLRTKPQSYNLMRLSDKKIGSMAISPSNSYQIATGSLDRTLKLWDIRKTVKKPEWSQYDDFPSHDIVSTYESRLSISAVSYSPTADTLVCNGYDNTIRLFDVSSVLEAELKPKTTIQHNCKTGRWVSILKAKFKQNKNVFAIANMKRAIDIYNNAGEQLTSLPTSTVPAVLSWHPLENWITGGNSSGKVFLFTDDIKDK
ncbi:HEL035Cp [Eremothecium sinecaudum]|uniref:DNA damage-binding protein CMR1 n=1 Tax=Eremothecium sinecaudum TaxID=45286 RepID=A0A0X8HTQ2_9SACH|nr:HEL035Cp [Eremothecium sinecaudum]AMD21245.1 HEL035Cp [Eremothecium sinecaudum]